MGLVLGLYVPFPPLSPFRAREIGWLADAMIRVETKNFIYFYLGQIAILLWKTS